MKKRYLLIFLLPLLLSCAVSGQAVSPGQTDAQARMREIYDTRDIRRTLPDEARQAVGTDAEGISLDDGLQILWRQGIKLAGSNFKSGLRLFITLLMTTMIIGLAGGLGGGDDTVKRPLMIAGVLAVAAVSIGDFHKLVEITGETVQQIESVSKSLLPMLVSATAASGAPAGAAARQAATALFSDVLITVINRFFIPCTYAYIAVITADAALENQSLGAIAGFMKWGVSGGLKLLLTMYVAYLTVSGVIAGASDAMLEKGAKLALSGMVPVVGGILSDASQTVAASAGLVRSSIGVFGLIAVLGVTLTPLIRIGLQYLFYRLASALCAPAAPAPLMKYIAKLADVFGLLLGITASASFMLLIAIVACMQAASG